jgi:MFS family permease
LLPLADVIGRKKLLLFGLFLEVVIYLFFIFLDISLTSYMGYVCVLGIGSSIRAAIGFTLCFEFSPVESRPYIGAAMFGLNGLWIILSALLFKYWTKDWKSLGFIALSVTVIAFCMLVFLPESPKYYFSKGLYSKAHDVIDKIAEENGKEPVKHIFDGEILDKLSKFSMRKIKQ